MRKSELPPHYKSLLFLLDSCTSIKEALQIQTQLFITSLHHQRLFLSKLISFFSLSNPRNPCNLSHSLLIFSHLSRPNIFIYNTLIRAHSRSQSPFVSITIYKSILSKAQTRPNNYTFPFLLRSCAKLPSPELGLQVHCHILKLGFDSDTYVRNSLIRLYSSFGDFIDAHQLFDEITEWGPVSFNVMISSYYKNGRPADGLRLFRKMIDLGVKPDRSTFACLSSIWLALGDVKSGKVVHMLALKYAGSDDFGNRLKTSLVGMYAKFGLMRMADRVFSTMGGRKTSAAWSFMVAGYAKCGKIAIARKLFDQMTTKDVISWTSIISGYSQNGMYKEALDLYKEMENEGVEPDEVTLCVVLSACAQLGYLDLGKRLHHYVEDHILSHDNSTLYTAIVDMYAKCGCIETALEIYDRVDKKRRTRSLVNSIISGLAQHGLGEKAVAIFKEMDGFALSPDAVTFFGVISACNHSTLIEEGKEIFDMMVKKYGIRPQIEHYSCMVDLLGRGGCLDEAYGFIKNMPIAPNSAIWEALLRCSGVHRNRRIGEIARRNILQLESNKPSPKGINFHQIEMLLDETKPKNVKKLRENEELQSRTETAGKLSI